MNGQDLRTFLKKHGLSEEVFADKAGITQKTLKYYLRPSVVIEEKSKKLAKFIEKLATELDDSRSQELYEAREHIADLHRKNFGHTGTNVYGNFIPNFPIADFDDTPRILTCQTENDHMLKHENDFDHTESSDTWSIWRKKFFNRCKKWQKGFDVELKTLLMGGPGSGKTTVVKLLLNENSKNFTVLCVPLAIYNSNNPPSSIVQATIRHYQEHLGYSHNISFSFLLNYEISQRRLVVLLDGFDEANSEMRQLIHIQSNVAGFPTVLTSRYVAPRLDSGIYTAEQYFMGGLSKKDIIAYIKNIKNSFHNNDNLQGNSILQALLNILQPREDRTKSNKNTHLNLLHSTPNAETPIDKILDKESNIFEIDSNDMCSSDESSLPFARQVSDLASSEEKISEWGARHQETLRLLQTPILLNIYITSCVRDNNIHTTLTSVLSSYARFIFGKWNSCRTLTPSTSSAMNVNNVEVEQALSVVAFSSILSEHCNGIGLKVSEAKDVLKEFFTDYARWPKKDLEEFIDKWLCVAEDAQILHRSGNTNILHFAAPHELLASYYASIFLSVMDSLDTGLSPSSRRKSPSRSIPKKMQITFKKIVSNPNLRCFQDATVFFAQQSIQDAKMAVPKNENMLFELLDTPPIAISESICSEEKMRRILPTGLILTARTISSMVNTNLEMRQYTSIITEVRNEITDLFLNTNIEYVYQSLMPLYQSMDCATHSIKQTNDINENLFRKLDREWRSTQDCEKLLELEKKIIEISCIKEQQKLRRRLVYRFRYLASTFNEEAFEWICNFADKNRKENSSSKNMLVLASLRMVRDNLDIRSSPDSKGRLLNEVSNYVSDGEEKLQEQRRQCAKKLRKLNYSHKIDWNQVIDDDDFDFDVMKWFPSILHDLVPDPLDEMQTVNLVNHIRERLETEQSKKVQDLQSRRVQARALFILRYVARSFNGQQYLTPQLFSLAEYGGFYPTKINEHDPSSILKVLFSGAIRGLDDDDDSQSNDWSLGGWQLYDYYVQTLWLTLCGMPSAARYDILVG